MAVHHAKKALHRCRECAVASLNRQSERRLQDIADRRHNTIIRGTPWCCSLKAAFRSGISPRFHRQREIVGRASKQGQHLSSGWSHFSRRAYKLISQCDVLTREERTELPDVAPDVHEEDSRYRSSGERLARSVVNGFSTNIWGIHCLPVAPVCSQWLKWTAISSHLLFQQVRSRINSPSSCPRRARSEGSKTTTRQSNFRARRASYDPCATTNQTYFHAIYRAVLFLI